MIDQNENKSVFIATQFRSGSTHLSMSLIRALGLKWASTKNGGMGDADQNIEAGAALALFPLKGLLYQQHMIAFSPNIEMLAQYGIFPVVSIRNIFDSVLSAKEQIERDSPLPGLYTPRGYTDLSDGERWSFVVGAVAPWIAQFQTSWAETRHPHFTVHYEDYHKDQVESLRDLLAKMGYGNAKRGVLEKICAQKDGRFYKGVSGRGLQEIPGKHIDKIRYILNGYPRDVVREMTR